MANGSELALILEGGKAAHENHSANLQRQAERIGLIERSAIAAPAFIAAFAAAFVFVYYSVNQVPTGLAMHDLASILAWFFGAILLSMTVPVFNRLRHLTQTMGLARQKLDFQAPYIHDSRLSRMLLQTSYAFKGAAMVAIAASYAALTVGGMALFDLVL
ncbi:MAG: hypothetical protein AAGC96_07400 [Pseudomonadota bacterium]